MNHHHHHGHSHSFTEHKVCVATIVFNILIIVAEVILQLVFAGHGARAENVLSYEVFVQLFHFIGILILALIQRRVIHFAKRHTVGKFIQISTLMLVVHIVALHIIPRLIGFEIHHEEHQEWTEYLVLAGIIIFVTLGFRFRDLILTRLNLKNRFTVSLKKK